MNEISSQTSDLALRLNAALVKRFKERRNVELTTLILYLNNPKIFTSNHHPDLELSTKSSTVRFGISIMERILNENDLPSENSSEGLTEELSLSIHERLQQSVNEITSTKTTVTKESNYKKEFTLFDRHQERTPRLNLLYDALLSVQPTSTQSERNFSLAGNFVSKLRTRLSDVHIDALCFLKSYFIARSQNHS